MKTIFGNKASSWSGAVIGIAAFGILLILYDRFFGSALAQGLIIIIIGCSLVGLLMLNYFNSGHSLFQYFVKHPGVPFLILSLMCFLTAVITIIGSMEDKQGSKFVIILNLLTSRFLPGIILIVLGTVFLCLGILEIFSPEYFDSIWGGFLEALFLGQQSK